MLAGGGEEGEIGPGEARFQIAGEIESQFYLTAVHSGGRLVQFKTLLQATPVMEVPLGNTVAALLPLLPISKVLADSALNHTVNRMQKKIEIFDQLRSAMRIAMPECGNGLNDAGDPDISTIKERVTRFRYSEEITDLASTNITYLWRRMAAL